jgi:flagellar export protein FliJ
VKKFTWRLQRLLDLKVKQENVMRTELVSITEQAVALRGRIMLQKTALRQMLAKLAKKDAKKRLKEQQLVLKYIHVTDKEIEELKTKLVELEKLRRDKIKQIMKIRKLRKGLEKLRADARAEFIKELEKFEQNELDDNTTITFARKILQHHI